MAHWLILAATPLETRYIRERVDFVGGELYGTGVYKGRLLHLLHGGVGMTNTAYSLGKYLADSHPEQAIQLGIAGAFENGPDLGEVVQVREEIYPELGAESPTGFLDMETLGLEVFQLNGHSYFNRIPHPHLPLAGLKSCTGSTVNTVHGIASSIQKTQQLWGPEVESMEGAAFFQVCLQENIPFHQIRSISNRVEVRNKDAWDITGALQALSNYFLDEMEF